MSDGVHDGAGAVGARSTRRRVRSPPGQPVGKRRRRPESAPAAVRPVRCTAAIEGNVVTCASWAPERSSESESAAAAPSAVDERGVPKSPPSSPRAVADGARTLAENESMATSAPTPRATDDIYRGAGPHGPVSRHVSRRAIATCAVRSCADRGTGRDGWLECRARNRTRGVRPRANDSTGAAGEGGIVRHEHDGRSGLSIEDSSSSMTSAPLAASRLPVGSSANSTRGCWRRRAIATRCCSPLRAVPESAWRAR